MSLVGPRPEMMSNVELYKTKLPAFVFREKMKAGLTGYAQVHGRNIVSWEDKFAMDVWYTRNITFANDVRIFFDTVKTVLKHEGISSETSATMEEFMGTPEGVQPEWKYSE